MRSAQRIASGLIGVVGLVACQSAQVSVQEAKRIPEQTVADVPLAPPPATIDDVLALLEQGPSPEFREQVAADRALAARPDPQPQESVSDRTNFYYQRGLAAMNAGMVGPAISDFARAKDLGAGRFGGRSEHILHALANAQEYGGNWSAHIRSRRESLTGAPEGAVLGRNSWLAANFALAGDVAAADGALRDAGSHLSVLVGMMRGGDAAWVPVIRAIFASGTAEVLAAHGKYQEAQAVFRQAAAEIDASIALGRQRTDYMSLAAINELRPLVKGQIHQGLSRSLRLQGRLLEAEVEARQAVRTLVGRWGRDNQYTASGVVTLSDVLLAEGRATEAERLARMALQVYDKTGALPESLKRAQARRSLAGALAQQERWAEAQAEFDRIERDMAPDPESVERFLRGDVDWALTLVRSGQGRRAVERLAPVAGPLEQRLGARDAQVGELRGVLGLSLAASGDRAQALREFRAALPGLLADSAQEGGEERGTVSLREQRLRAVLEAYVSTLASVGGGESVAEAFRVADTVRGRTVQRAIGAGAARAAAKDAALAELVRQDQDAEKRLATLYRQLADITVRPKDPKNREDTRPSAETVRTQIDQLSRAREGFAKGIASQFPAYADLTNPRPATLEQAQQALREGEALIAVLAGREASFVWAVPSQGAPAFAAVPLSAEKLGEMVSRLRKSVIPVSGTLVDQPAFDADAAWGLYRALLKPVEAAFRETKSLLVVPHGPLGQLPFGILLTEPAQPGPQTGVPFAQYRGLPFLVRRMAVTQLPSVASLGILRAVPPGSAGRRPFVGFGDPYFSVEQARRAAAEVGVMVSRAGGSPVGVRAAPATAGVVKAQLAFLPRLPDTAEEIRSLAASLGGDPERDVFLGARANEQNVKTLDLGVYQVIAFATHGLVPGSLEGLTQPALALSAPEVAGVEGDGLLAMDEILGLRLNADWVVLSACDTAAAQGAGTEAVSGLGRAFFYAGTRAVLVTHWSVESSSARALTTELFRRQREDPTLDRARALQQTMNWLIDSGQYVDPATGRAAFSYAHPMFWAPFALVGDGGASVAPRR
jgi:CHAT domain-containing protein